MSGIDALFVALLALGQVGVLLLSQYAVPEYYFSSGSFFIRRAEVKWKAVLFRLAIPFSAGLLVPLLPVDDENLVAVAAGALAWFLVLWPIVWAPALMVPPIAGLRWLVALWLVFWVAFATLPLSGVALMNWIRAVLNDPDASWWEEQIAGQLFLLIPVLGITLFVASLVNQRVPLRGGDDPPSEELDDEEWQYDEEPQRRSLLEPAAWHFTAAIYSAILVPFLLLGILVAIVTKGRSWRAGGR